MAVASAARALRTAHRGAAGSQVNQRRCPTANSQTIKIGTENHQASLTPIISNVHSSFIRKKGTNAARANPIEQSSKSDPW
eukprot:1961120-Pyramimonas_sp.AAC.1